MIGDTIARYNQVLYKIIFIVLSFGVSNLYTLIVYKKSLFYTITEIGPTIFISFGLWSIFVLFGMAFMVLLTGLWYLFESLCVQNSTSNKKDIDVKAYRRKVIKQCTEDFNVVLAFIFSSGIPIILILVYHF